MVSSMAEYHVGCGAFGIYAGTLKKNGKEWQNKTECTDEALCAVRDWLYGEAEQHHRSVWGYEWKRKDGKVVELLVKIREQEPPEGSKYGY